MSTFEWQKMQQEQQEFEIWLDMLEQQAIIEEEHPDLEKVLDKLEYQEER